MPGRRIRTMLAAGVAAALLVGIAACAPEPVPVPVDTLAPDPVPTTPPADKPKSFFNRSANSIDDPNSIWVVIDKLRRFQPVDYVPPDLVQTPVPHTNPPTLRAVAADAMVQMFAAAAAEGAGSMQLLSAYRSYSVQVSVYGRYAANEGVAGADTHSARPGFSEHQTGLVADIGSLPSTCALAACFGQTPQGTWLAENAWRFGFLLRYPADKTPVTGYIYEPWHFRYIGVELATEMHEKGITTLEEFFGLPPAPAYAD